MKTLCLLPMAALLASCSTINQSFELGAGMGAASGAAAVYAGSIGQERGPSLSTVAIGAGVGAGIGLLTSYLVHRSVEDDRQALQADQTEMHFGDLPPSPFVIPKAKPSKKGGR